MLTASATAARWASVRLPSGVCFAVTAAGQASAATGCVDRSRRTISSSWWRASHSDSTMSPSARLADDAGRLIVLRSKE